MLFKGLGESYAVKFYQSIYLTFQIENSEPSELWNEFNDRRFYRSQNYLQGIIIL